MKPTIYDLLRLLKNVEAPLKIKYDGEIWYLCDNIYDYANLGKRKYLFNDMYNNVNVLIEHLDDFVDIIEENDEWEDIEELRKLHTTDYSYDTAVENRKAINQLIKNQKYLKEKIENYDSRKD